MTTKGLLSILVGDGREEHFEAVQCLQLKYTLARKKALYNNELGKCNQVAHVCWTRTFLLEPD